MDEVNLEFLTKLATNIEDGTEINSVSISKLTRAGNFIQEVLLSKLSYRRVESILGHYVDMAPTMVTIRRWA